MDDDLSAVALSTVSSEDGPSVLSHLDWAVYMLMFLVNALTAFFTPLNQSTVSLMV